MTKGDPGVSRYVFKRKTFKAPVDYTGYLSADEIKKIETEYGPLECVVRKDVGTIRAEDYKKDSKNQEVNENE